MAEVINQGETQPWNKSPAEKEGWRNVMQAACTALHMPPAVSTHPREPEIRRLAEAAAGELAARASTQPQSGVGTREKANRGSALPTPSKEDPKCSLNFTLSSNIQRNSQSAFCPNAIGCKKLSWLDPCCTSWQDVDSSHPGFPVGSFSAIPFPGNRALFAFPGFLSVANLL